MKSSLTILSAVATLATGVALSGSEFNAPVVLAICVAATISGLFVADYNRPSTCNLDPVKAPVRQASACRSVEHTPVFASLIVFNTTIA